MTRLDRRHLATLLVAVLATPAGALAAEKSLAAFFPEGQNACWGRSYDAAHMAAHPRQKVKAIHFSDPWGERPHLEIPDDLDYHDPGGDRLAEGNAAAELLVERVDVPGIWGATVECRAADGKLRCFHDEDDPKAAKQPFEVVARDGALFATLNPPGIDFVRAPDRAAIDRPPTELRLEPGADDRTFRLERLSPDVCRGRHLASAPDYVREGGPPLRAAILAALRRAETPTGFKHEAARMCLTGRSTDDAPVRVGLDPGLVDSMVGIDAVPVKAARGEGAARRVFDMSCQAGAWKWSCSWTAPETESRPWPEHGKSLLIRRKGGVLFLDMRCLQRDCRVEGAAERSAPPLSLDLVDPKICPEDLFHR